MTWTEQSLADHFFAAAEARATEDGRKFGDGAENDLRALVLHGARTLLASTPPQDLDTEVEIATSRIEGLIGLAIAEARNLKDYDPSKLGEQTYFPAKARFCPCRPFC